MEKSVERGDGWQKYFNSFMQTLILAGICWTLSQINALNIKMSVIQEIDKSKTKQIENLGLQTDINTKSIQGINDRVLRLEFIIEDEENKKKKTLPTF